MGDSVISWWVKKVNMNRFWEVQIDMVSQRLLGVWLCRKYCCYNYCCKVSPHNFVHGTKVKMNYIKSFFYGMQTNSSTIIIRKQINIFPCRNEFSQNYLLSLKVKYRFGWCIQQNFRQCKIELNMDAKHDRSSLSI